MNPKKEFSPIPTLFLRIGCLLVLYTLVRLVFLAYNLPAFPTASCKEFLFGLRFDISALAYINALYAVLILVPANFVFTKAYRKISNCIFLIFNIIPLVFSFVDIGYFPYEMRRSTAAVFSFLHGANNMTQLLPQFLHDFWSIALLFLLFLAALVLIVKFIDYSTEQKFDFRSLSFIKTLAIRMITIALFIIGCRGGCQLRPINNASASHYTSVENVPLVLNTPFSILTTFGKEELEKKSYLPENELDGYFTPIKTKSVNNLVEMPPFENIVIIILEGISSEYSEFLAQEPKNVAGFTPFLDSIARQGILFEGYANGQQSIVALPAILGGVPSLLDVAFTQSPYATNRIAYPVGVLKRMGYHCAFYHGGANGTMEFDKFCKIIGMDEYNGLNEYPNKNDYDGHWGIFDGPYLQYVANELDRKKSPFLACLYTLSSHHPYTVPEKYKERLPKGEYPMQQTVAYTDMALRQFFEKCSRSAWYDKTLFVITADHTNFAESKHNHSGERYNVPMIFFHPQNRHPQKFDRIAQQTDIMASILGLLNASEPFISYGNNLFDTTQTAFAIHYAEPCYHLKVQEGEISFDGNNEWHCLPDSMENGTYYRNFLKAFIQQYNNRMVKNDFSTQGR